MKDKSKIKSSRWNYLAGLFDGDGHLSITAHPHLSNYINYDVIMGITTTHRPTAVWLKTVFGGKFSTSEDKRPNRKLRFFWYVSSSESQIIILKNIEDRLLIKKQQAKKILEFLELGGRKFQDSSVRKLLYEEVQVLNSQFIPVFKITKSKPLLKASRADIQYLAGLIDAEGCISLYESKRSFDPKIQLSNTDMRVFEFLVNLFGGSVSSHKRENRILGNWILPVSYLEKTLLATIPYLVTKRKQAILLLTWFRKRKILDDDATRLYLREFRNLNLRGTSPTTNTTNSSEKELKIESDLIGDYERVQPVMAVT